MKKLFGKALAMAVMMSVLAGGSAYADDARFSDGMVIVDGADGYDRSAILTKGGLHFYPGGSPSYYAYYGLDNLKIGDITLDDKNGLKMGGLDIANVKDITATGTVVIDGARPITLNPNGSADGTQSIEIAGMNNYITAMGSDRFEITQNGEVHVGIYAGGMHAYGDKSEGYLVSEGLKILSNNADVPSMAFATTIVDVGNNVIHSVGIGTEDTDAVNKGQMDAELAKKADASDLATKADAATTLAGYGITDGATKTELEGKADKATTLAGYGITDGATKTELEGKADKATTLAGYGITDGATKTELEGKADKATTLAGYGITDAYTKSETDTAIAAATYDDTAIKADIAKKADKTDLDAKADKSALETEATTRQDADDNLQSQIDTLSSSASAGMSELASKINQTDARMDRVGATAAALAAINYQPMAKGQSQVAIGMGGYNGKKATAIGLAYQFDNRISGSVAGAANGSERMFNVGFNYLFGQHTAKDIAPMAASNSVSLKEAELQAQVDSLNDKVARLEAMVKALAAK